MRRPNWRWWQRGHESSVAQMAQVADVTATPVAADAPDLALPRPAVADGDAHPTLEQPVLLTASGAVRPVRIGEVLPARQHRWPLSVVRLPVVPKRAILAAGVCAGLAAPQIVKHLATRLLLGNAGPAAHAGVQGALEITRIVYNGPLTPAVTEAIGKALAAGRR
ncbi:MAG: hypothetical protein IT306_10910 [Chloroflexi bacterium]|nr:hypothetical protein [Chloroflexota bacterium]